MAKGAFADIDAYIASFPAQTQLKLAELRTTIRAAVPDGDETISYQIPTITRGAKALVYFAGWKRHLSIYPVPAADEDLERELAPYRAARSSLHFALDAPLPVELITRVIVLLERQRITGS